MLLCIVATGQVLRQAKATNRQFADSKGEATSLEKIVIDFNCIYRIPVRVAFSFLTTSNAN